MGAALDAAKANSDPSATPAWLAHAGGASVIVSPDTQAELIGPSPSGDTWDVRSATGAKLSVRAGAIRRVPVTRGDTVRVVVGDSLGFVGTVLSADNGVGVLRSMDASMKVKVLPLDALCALVQQVDLS